MIKNILIFLISLTIIGNDAWAIIVSPNTGQKNYRWRSDDGNETSATWKASLNNAYTYTTGDLASNIRLRIEIDNTGEDVGTIANSLQYSLDGVTWVNVTTSAGSNHWMFAPSTHVTHDAITTAQLVSGLGGSFIEGRIISNTTGATFSLSYGYRTENEYVLMATNNVQSFQTYYFRVGGLDTYVNNGVLNTGCLAKITDVTHGVLCTPGGTTTLSAEALSGNTITWYDEDDIVVGTGTTFVTPALFASTTYYAEAEGSSCVSEKVPVNVNFLSSFEDYTLHDEDFVCGSGTVTLSIDVDLPSVTIEWYEDPDASTSVGTGSSFTTPEISTSTTYYIVLTVESCSSDPIPITANVRALPTITITPSADTICADGEATFVVTEDANYSYLWDSGETTSSITTSVIGEHTVTVTDITTTCESTATATLELMGTASVSGFTYEEVSETEYRTINFTPTDDVWATSYLWNFGDGITSTLRTPTHMYTTDGSFVVKLIVSNECNSDTVETTIDIQPDPSSIDALGWENILQIYPNPTQGEITIQSDMERRFNQINIINTLGQTVYTSQFQSTDVMTIDISTYPKGQYFILIMNEEGQKVVKPIIYR